MKQRSDTTCKDTVKVLLFNTVLLPVSL